MRTKLGQLLLFVLGTGGCTAIIERPDGTAGEPPLGNAPTQTQACREGASLAPARITLLSDTEYTNVVRDVFGVDFVPEGNALDTGEYQLNESAQVGSIDVAKRYLRAADQVAGKLTPCGSGAVTTSCLSTFLKEKLPRAWKRPVRDEEVADLLAIFSAGAPDGEKRALELVMEAALGSASFLYRTEVGTDASGPTGVVALTPYELAAALSFSASNTVPDEQLWAAAEDGTITHPATLSAQVDRLLQKADARDNLTKKVSYYLNVEKIPSAVKDATTFPEFTASLQASLYRSAVLFVNDLVWNGKLGDLFTSNKYYANAELAEVYGLPTVQGSGFVEIELPPQRNAGFLSHPGLLATTNLHTSSDDVVHRGLWIYSNLVCGSAIGAPPAGALDVAATFTGSDREKTRQRNAMPQCRGCHGFFDPFGIVSENFDPIGRYRTTAADQGSPMSSSAIITGIGPDVDGEVASLKDVADRLKAGRRVADCAVARLAQYALNHDPNEQRSCALGRIKDDFAASGRFSDLFEAILKSPGFTTRDLGP